MVSHSTARAKQLLKCFANTQSIDKARVAVAILHWNTGYCRVGTLEQDTV